MAIKFETYDIPSSLVKQEIPPIPPEEEKRILKGLAKADANLRRKMKEIARKEAEAWKKSQFRG